MRTFAAMGFVLSALCLTAGCDSDDTDSDGSPSLGTNTGGSMGGTASSGQVGSASGETTSTVNPGAAGGVDPSSGVGSTASTGDAGSSAQTGDNGAASGGSGSTASGSGTGASGDSGTSASDGATGGVSASGPEPTIPEVTGECPVFQSGETQIMGLNVNLYAGTPVPGKPGPLVFFWHGTGGSGDNVERSPFPGGQPGIPDAVRAEILAEGGIIVSPTDTTREGVDVTFLLGVWHTTGDFGFADLMVSCAVKNHNVDPRRIYTTGCSAGGLMSGTMAYHRSSYLAAAAPNSGGVAPIPGLNVFQDDRYIPAVMSMYGANDEVIVRFEDTSKALNSDIVSAGGFAINCNHGGGHCGAPAELLTAAWQFMKDHPFGVAPEPYANGLPASFPSYCEIVQ